MKIEYILNVFITMILFVWFSYVLQSKPFFLDVILFMWWFGADESYFFLEFFWGMLKISREFD